MVRGDHRIGGVIHERDAKNPRVSSIVIKLEDFCGTVKTVLVLCAGKLLR